MCRGTIIRRNRSFVKNGVASLWFWTLQSLTRGVSLRPAQPFEPTASLHELDGAGRSSRDVHHSFPYVFKTHGRHGARSAECICRRTASRYARCNPLTSPPPYTSLIELLIKVFAMYIISLSDDRYNGMSFWKYWYTGPGTLYQLPRDPSLCLHRSKSRVRQNLQ